MSEDQTPTVEEFARTIAVYEAAAIKTGQWDGIDAPEFSADGVAWSKAWGGVDAPAFARVSVYRKGVLVPYEAVIAWAETQPADEAWMQLWRRKPMTMFGAAAKRAAIRHAFRDVIGDHRDPDELVRASPGPRVDAPRDWDAEIVGAPTVEKVDAVWSEARGARARTAAREVAYKARRQELVSEEWEPEEAPPATRDSTAPDAPSVARRRPQDHLPPANRAARRAHARKKRGKR